MREAQFTMLLSMFELQTRHVIGMATKVIKSDGIAAAREEIEREVNYRLEQLDKSHEADGTFEFIDALVLPSLYLAALYLDLDMANCEIIMDSPGHYSLVSHD